jgi:hypothetical protein
MSEKPTSSDATTQVRRHLHAVANLLRAAHRLTPEAQALLADLVDELAHALESEEVSHDDVAHVTESTSHLVQAVHEKHEPGMLEAAEDRLERAVVAVESKAPALASLTRRLAEMLSDLGI